MIQSVEKINKVSGSLSFRGDKSISHRALLISSLADGQSVIRNLSNSDDVRSTINCLRELGIHIEVDNNVAIVFGRGFKGYQKPAKPMDAGNSGTTARLLTGILAAQNFESIIIGDESLSSRPMKRVIEPLTQMNAKIENHDGKLPLRIFSTDNLNSLKYEMPVASAQVKSAILLAGLHLDDTTTVIESTQTRNHTENLLNLEVSKKNQKIVSKVSKNNYPEPKEYFIPGDISSAMFFIVLTLLSNNSEMTIKNLSLNPTRTECLNILKRMGAKIEIEEKGTSNKEIFGDIIVQSSHLKNIEISSELIPSIIDEIPILTIAGLFAEGNFVLRGASELRIKESDRIKAICCNLLKLGLIVEEFFDGFNVSGKLQKPSEPFEGFGDHRIAMAFAILSSLLESGGEVNGFEYVSVSNPKFLSQLSSITS
ncbi:MAG: 3-phosphoshikimate 1-carboxyvinyltransferase [bacterium]|nr:3-phosphoshikimate 1-carboxyvinyltransferase [bacterium]